MSHKSSPLTSRLGFSLNWPLKHDSISLYLLNYSLVNLIHYFLSRYKLDYMKLYLGFDRLLVYVYKKFLNYRLLKNLVSLNLKKSYLFILSKYGLGIFSLKKIIKKKVCLTFSKNQIFLHIKSCIYFLYLKKKLFNFLSKKLVHLGISNPDILLFTKLLEEPQILFSFKKVLRYRLRKPKIKKFFLGSSFKGFDKLHKLRPFIFKPIKFGNIHKYFSKGSKRLSSLNLQHIKVSLFRRKGFKQVKTFRVLKKKTKVV